MNQKEKEILKIEESFKDTIENDIYKNNTQNKKLEIKDIKYVGQATWQDKVNGEPTSDKVFIVDIEIKEIDEEGKVLLMDSGIRIPMEQIVEIKDTV